MGLDRGQRRFFLFLTLTGVVILLFNLSMLAGVDVRSKVTKVPIPGAPKLPSGHQDKGNTEKVTDIADQHPIFELMKQADESFRLYDEDRSTTFKETVTKYRRKYGRNPPPGFREWYKFARDHNVYNVDDFEQIMDDLRPFWGVEPAVIRSYAANLNRDKTGGISGIHVRNGKVWKLTNADGGTAWRAETLAKMMQRFVKHLPDMDIAMNRLDQPRIAVPWDDMQALLASEIASRRILPESSTEWTKDMTGFFKDDDTEPLLQQPEWFGAAGKQYMDIAKEACPPGSHARDPLSSQATAEATYKSPQGGFITNFNLSSDLCTIGPEIQRQHGFLYASSSTLASKLPLPVFGECKTNINNDILFPANMYFTGDERYTYKASNDLGWDDKEDNMIWRGVTSGGTNTADTWKTMHRQRLALLTNATVMEGQDVRIMSMDPNNAGSYQNYEHFMPSEFAAKYTDVAFSEATACTSDGCPFYKDVWTYKPGLKFKEQFKNKFLIDVDGHSFSGRWHAFLQSKSLGIKSTIFREWHDSRLFAWRHFVPLDNRYDELYSILTYFIGLGDPKTAGRDGKPYVQRHDFEARKLGRQGREWAARVLRNEDIEIYLFRLLIEYARIIDDNRDRIGYSGDGSELDKYDSKNPLSLMHG
ncbi:capsular associated protein [Rutstroemia sp. NJR-2017a BVV2]|nr:capsular associated protein [Rutstroemia sp. NJR-2017a BVV2]